MAKLSEKGRRLIEGKNFASPKGTGDDKDKDAYPIHDKAHARAALSRVSRHGSEEEKKRVRAAVKKKYPGIGKS